MAVSTLVDKLGVMDSESVKGTGSSKGTGPDGVRASPTTAGRRNVEAGDAYQQAAASCCGLIRRGLKAALATFEGDPETALATPYASLVITACAPDGAPLLLISNLARHTKNLRANARASLMFDETGPMGDLSVSSRVTLIGSFKPTTEKALARRFISRHVESAGYASFADFGFYEMAVESAHFVGGFGRIVDVARDDLLTGLEGADDLLAAEPDIIAHMNEDHADAVALYATRLLGAEGIDGPWRMSGIDPGGIDIIGRTYALRLDFKTRVTTAMGARDMFKDLAHSARHES